MAVKKQDKKEKTERYMYYVDAAGVKVIREVQEKYRLGSRGSSAALRIILDQYAEIMHEREAAKNN